MTSNLSIEKQIKCAASRKPAGKKTTCRIQRDELLEALKSIHRDSYDAGAVEFARAVISKIESGEA